MSKLESVDDPLFMDDPMPDDIRSILEDIELSQSWVPVSPEEDQATDDPDWAATPEWFERFDDDAFEVAGALDCWRAQAISLLSRVGREENALRLPNVDSLGAIVVPTWFDSLTDLIVAWGHRSALVIDLTHLLQFRDQVCACARDGIDRRSLWFDMLFKIVEQCVDVTYRLHSWMKFSQRNDATNANRPGGAKLAPIETDDEKWTSGPFGLSIQRYHRRARRDGYDGFIELSALRWHVFLELFRADGNRIDRERLKQAYSGEWTNEAIGQKYHELRKILKPIGMTVERGRLKPLDEASKTN